MATPETDRIVITGDSFVEGVGAHRAGWAQQLADALAPRSVAVHGIGGHTSSDLIARVGRELEPLPACVIVGIGINDARWRSLENRHEVAIDQFAANVDAVIDLVVQHASDLWFVGLTSVDEALTNPFKEDKHYHNLAIARYDVCLREIAERRRVGYIAGPDLADVDDGLDDGLHPSDIGHGLLLRTVRDATGL